MEFFEKLGFFLKKNAPAILTTIGVGATIAGTVTAAVAGSKTDKKLKPHREKIDTFKANIVNDPDNLDQHKKNLRKEYALTVLELTKLYIVPTTLTAVGLGCMIASPTILSKRNVALAGAYTALQTSYAGYRAAVQEKLGAVDEGKLYLESQTEKVKMIGDNGEETTTEVPKEGTFNIMWSAHGRNWEDEPTIRFQRLLQNQDFAQSKCDVKKYLFVADVINMFGIPENDLTDYQLKYIYKAGWLRGDKINFGYHDAAGNLNEKGYKLLNEGFDSLLIELNPRPDITTPAPGVETLIDAVRG